MKHLAYPLLLIVLMPLLASCINSDTVDGTVDMTYYDIVTFNGNTDGQAVFTFHPVSDADMVTLTSSEQLDTASISPGSRAMICYVPLAGKPYVDSEIQLQWASEISTLPLYSGIVDEITDWNRDPLYVLSLWRDGSYLNLRMRMPYDRKSRLFVLFVDKFTIESSHPELYLAHALDSITEADTYLTQMYACFDIKNLWERPYVEAITVNINNSNNTTLKQFTFTK